MQLVATTAQETATYSNRADEVITNTSAVLSRFGQSKVFDVARSGDELLETFLATRIGPLPAGCGWRWVDHMPQRLLEKKSLEIGGQAIWQQTGHGEVAWTVSHTVRDESMYLPAADGSYEFLLPIDNLPIPMVAIAFHIVKYTLETAPLSELVTPDPAVAEATRQPLAAVEAAIEKSFTLRHIYRFHDTNKRGEMAKNKHSFFYTTLRSDTIYPAISDVSRQVRLQINGNLCATGAYIHVLDEQGNELPSSCVEQVAVKLNGHDRHRLTGLESRTMMRHKMACKPRDDVKSANLYFLSYGAGQIRPDGREEGLQMGRIDNIVMELLFKSGTPEKLRVTVAHRYSQNLRIETGIGGIGWTDRYSLTLLSDAWKIGGPATPPFGTELEGGIPLLEGDTCPISYSDLAVGADVCMCGSCKKVFEEASMRRWLDTQRQGDKSCPACRHELTANNFFYGKGRAGTEEERLPAAARRPAVAAAATPGAGEGEGVGLLAAPPAQPTGFFARISAALFSPP